MTTVEKLLEDKAEWLRKLKALPLGTPLHCTHKLYRRRGEKYERKPFGNRSIIWNAIYIGWRITNDGRFSDDWGYEPQGYYSVILVAYHPRRAPVFVLPEDVVRFRRHEPLLSAAVEEMARAQNERNNADD